jgi:hypothetical protein
MGINQPQEAKRTDGIYDEKGLYLAPLAGNDCYQPAPEQRCIHGRLCQSCRPKR